MFEDEEYLSDDYFENFDVDCYYDDNFGFRSYSYSDEDFEDHEDFHDCFPSIEEEYPEDQFYGNYPEDHYYESDNFGNYFLDDWY